MMFYSGHTNHGGKVRMVAGMGHAVALWGDNGVLDLGLGVRHVGYTRVGTP